jgi:hypothetical protein
MSFEKEIDGTYTLNVIHDHGSIPLELSGELEGLEVGYGNIIPWGVIDEIKSKVFSSLDEKVSANPILEYRPNTDLKPDELYYVEDYRICKDDLILRVSVDNAGSRHLGPPVEFDINRDNVWRSNPAIVDQGDDIRLRIRTPLAGTCQFNIFLNEMLAIMLTTTVK